MSEITHKELLPGVRLIAVQTNKFKTCLIGMTLLAPLESATASAGALHPQVLRPGTRNYPSMERLSAALDELYGGAITPMVRKKGETQCVGFVGSFLDDIYTPDSSKILEPAAALLGDMLLHPVLENGCFRSEYVTGERSNLVDRIRAQVNDKRQYSLIRATQIMCESEPYGVDSLGDEKNAAAITQASLWEHYQHLLKTAPIALYYCGSAPVSRVEEALKAALSDLPRTGERTLPTCTVVPFPAKGVPRITEDRMDVTQGKLAVGFRTGGASALREDLPAFLVFNAIYGGTTTSKLFMNVREKLSLCYFASSLIEKYKGIMLVSAGIEFDKYEQTKKEIIAQLDACKEGKIDNAELEGAKRSVISTLRANLDSLGRLEDFWLGQAGAGLTEGPDELALRVNGVTAEQAASVAKNVMLDTIYFLRGKEG